MHDCAPVADSALATLWVLQAAAAAAAARAALADSSQVSRTAVQRLEVSAPRLAQAFVEWRRWLRAPPELTLSTC